MEQQETNITSTTNNPTQHTQEVSRELPSNREANAQSGSSSKVSSTTNLKTIKDDILRIQPQDIGLYDNFIKHMKHIRDINDITAILRCFPIQRLNPDSYVPVNIPNDDNGDPILNKDNFLSPIDGTPGIITVTDSRMEVSRIPNPNLVSVQTEVQTTMVSKGRQMYRNAPYTSVMHYPLQIGDYQLDSACRTPIVYPLARWLYYGYSLPSASRTFEIISIDYYEDQLAKNDTTFNNLADNAIRDPEAIYLDLSSTNGLTEILAKLGIFEFRNVIDLSNTVGRQGPERITAATSVSILDYDIAKILDDTLTYQDIDLGLWYLAAPILAYTDYDPTHWKATTSAGWNTNYSSQPSVTEFQRLEIAIPRYNQAEAIISYFFKNEDELTILSSSVSPSTKYGYVFTDILLDYRLVKTFAMQECLKAKGCMQGIFTVMFPQIRDTLRFACLNIRNYHDLPDNIGGLNQTHVRMLYGPLVYKAAGQTSANTASGPLRTELFFPATIPYEIVSQYEPDHGAQEMKYLQCRNKYNGYIAEVVRPASQVVPLNYTVNNFKSNIAFRNVAGYIYYLDYKNKLNTSAQARQDANDTSTLFRPIAIVDVDGNLVGRFPMSTRCSFNAIHSSYTSNPTATTACYRNFDTSSDIITTKLASNNFHTSFSDYKTY